MGKSNGPIRAAGVVLLKEGPDGPLVCVVHRPRHQDWSLPKGKLDSGESPIEAARRETIEETGCDVTLGVPLTTQYYFVDDREKTVEYWVGWLRAGGPGFEPNREIDEMRWLPPQPALDMLTYPRDGDIVHEALAAPRTTALVLLRHAEAMPRSEYSGKVDAERPLTAAGERQARVLIDVLDAFGVTKVYSSDYRRCLDTVRPFARTHHLAVNHEPLLGEQSFAAAKGAAFARVDKLLEEDESSVICTHRPLLPAMVMHVADRLGLEEELDPVLAPGEGLVFHVDDKQCVAVEKVSS